MFNKLGILNTKLPVLLACVLINVPLIIWFLISFFQDLPEEVEESAKVDGATECQLFCRIVLPLVAPGIAAVAMPVSYTHLQKFPLYADHQRYAHR